MLVVDKFSRVPIYEQIISGIERMILSGELEEKDALPSVRQLSLELSVNPNTLQKAYAELEQRGICFSVPGSGRYVSDNALDIIKKERRAALSEIERITRELIQCGVGIDEITAAVNNAFKGELS